MENRLDNIQSLVPSEDDRQVLDTYIQLALEGAPDPIRTLAEVGGEGVLAVVSFLSVPSHQEYLAKRLEALTLNPLIDRFRILQDLRTIAFASPKKYLTYKECIYTDRLGKEHTRVQADIRDFDEISEQDFKAIKSIKYDKFGNVQVDFHDSLRARELLAKYEGIDKPKQVKKAEKKVVRLFDMRKAERVDEDEEVPDYEDEDGKTIDASFVSNIRKGPSVIDERKAKTIKNLAEEESKFNDAYAS